MESSGGGGRHNSTGVTLNAILSDKRGPIRQGVEPFPRAQSNRTLLDIIRDDQTSGGASQIYSGKKSWRHFKDKLRRRRGAAWTSTFSTPASDVPINNRTISRRSSGSTHSTDISAVPDIDPELMSNSRHKAPPSLQRNSSRALERASGRSEHMSSLGMRRLQREDKDSSSDDDEDREEDEYEDNDEESGGESDEEEEEELGEGEDQPVRMSLMALLAETDEQMGLDGSSYMMDDDDDEDDDDEDDRGGGEYNNCCVCMVRHKGAAFIPCGHTFCRLCSRELWVQRGNCPLCNNYILEILDIF